MFIYYNTEPMLQKDAIYYVIIATVIFSTVKIIGYSSREISPGISLELRTFNVSN